MKWVLGYFLVTDRPIYQSRPGTFWGIANLSLYVKDFGLKRN